MLTSKIALTKTLSVFTPSHACFTWKLYDLLRMPQYLMSLLHSIFFFPAEIAVLPKNPGSYVIALKKACLILSSRLWFLLCYVLVLPLSFYVLVSHILLFCYVTRFRSPFIHCPSLTLTHWIAWNLWAGNMSYSFLRPTNVTQYPSRCKNIYLWKKQMDKWKTENYTIY